MSNKIPTPSSMLYSSNCGKRLYPGQLLNTLTKSLRLQKNARNNALAREFLSSTSGDMFSVVKNVIQSLAPKDPQQLSSFYQTAFLDTLEWIRNSPDESFVKLQRKVEVHNHFSQSLTSSSSDERPTSPDNSITNATLPSVNHATIPSVSKIEKKISQMTIPQKANKNDLGGENKQKPESKTGKRTRFLDHEIRKATKSAFPCPYDKPSCMVCLGLWRRLRRCRKPNCDSKHTDGAHVVLNATELRFVKGKHAEYWDERAQAKMAKPYIQTCGDKPKRKIEWTAGDEDVEISTKRSA